VFACLHAPGNAALLVECASHFSPLIEETSPDAVTFDIDGLQRIYGGLEQIAAAIQLRVGIEARLGIASNPDAAVHVTLGLPGVMIVASGQEAKTLAPLPLPLLGGSPEFAHSMNLWGIRTFGEFAALPELGVAARLGEEGSHLQRLARGAGQRRLRLRTDPQVFRAFRELEDTVDLLEPLLFLLSQMLSEIAEQLRFFGRYTNEVRLRLKLEQAPDHRATLRLPVPMLDTKVLLKLLQLELSDRPPQAPIEKIWLELMPVEPRGTQHDLFLPSSPVPEKLEITLARIRALVGAGNVGAAKLLDTHRPDSFEMSALTATRGSVPLRLKLTLRRFRPPVHAQVWCTGGKPVRLVSSMGGGPVLAWAGPWHTSGDWWAGTEWNRQEWDVETQSLGASRIFQDRSLGRWFIEGNYD
jgi:protein ImuB